MEIKFYDDCACPTCVGRRIREAKVTLRDVTSQKRPVLDKTSYEPLTRQLVERRLHELEAQNADLQASNNKLLDRARRAEALNREYEQRLYPGDTA